MRNHLGTQTAVGYIYLNEIDHTDESDAAGRKKIRKIPCFIDRKLVFTGRMISKTNSRAFGPLSQPAPAVTYARYAGL